MKLLVQSNVVCSIDAVPFMHMEPVELIHDTTPPFWSCIVNDVDEGSDVQDWIKVPANTSCPSSLMYALSTPAESCTMNFVGTLTQYPMHW